MPEFALRDFLLFANFLTKAYFCFAAIPTWKAQQFQQQ